MHDLSSTQLAADRLVKIIAKKHAQYPEFELLMKYKDAATVFDLVPRKYDGTLELLGYIQDPGYQEIKVPFRRWFTLAVLSPKRIESLYE